VAAQLPLAPGQQSCNILGGVRLAINEGRTHRGSRVSRKSSTLAQHCHSSFASVTVATTATVTLWPKPKKGRPQCPTGRTDTGTVGFHHKWKLIGFIQVQQPGTVPNDSVFTL